MHDNVLGRLKDGVVHVNRAVVLPAGFRLLQYGLAHFQRFEYACQRLFVGQARIARGSFLEGDAIDGRRQGAGSQSVQRKDGKGDGSGISNESFHMFFLFP